MHIMRQHIAQLLSEVDDPEIPGVSIVDLGMVVDIRPESDHWQIDLATTYSGCPAIDVIPFLVKTHLHAAGLDNVRATMILDPAWSTDWISEFGKAKLVENGIAPPADQAMQRHDEGRPEFCPQCHATELKEISRYGATPCKAVYQCTSCMETFDYFKCY